jgi:hypothetical protein
MPPNFFDEDDSSQMTSLARRQFYPNKKQNDRTDDRQNEARRMKRRTWFRFGKQASDQSANDRATDTDQPGHDETELLSARHNRACNQSDDETDMMYQMKCNIVLLGLSRRG